jgi:hypothetical protein
LRSYPLLVERGETVRIWRGIRLVYETIENDMTLPIRDADPIPVWPVREGREL